jgi:hypothetical protein
MEQIKELEEELAKKINFEETKKILRKCRT